MKYVPKIWTSIGLGFAVIGAGLLVACDGERVKASSSVESVGVDDHGDTGKGVDAGEIEHADAGTLPRHLRLAFMSGHVEAGLALFRAGEPEMAAKHLLHPVSETHAAERAGLDELGFDAGLFEVVSTALDEGRAASEIEPQLVAAEANLAETAVRAGGDTIEIITFLMETIDEEYAVGVTGGAVTDPGEYQDAYGFAIVALDRANALQGDAGTRVREEIERLISLWSGTPPIPTETPAALSIITAQTRVVLGELSELR